MTPRPPTPAARRKLRRSGWLAVLRPIISTTIFFPNIVNPLTLMDGKAHARMHSGQGEARIYAVELLFHPGVRSGFGALGVPDW
ncbi:hypothetical protein GCM10023198_36170 [Promicromonospora umidemergens]|uniref:Uncharacterized protein n=1 Tax=Promicromonospora umidemergens TaxID=629679 RepID=A0ABP8XNX1_9MICO